jgi:ribosome-associated protein
VTGVDERTHRRVTRSVLLPLSEIELRVSRSSGPGGQHVNTAETRVEAVLDVEASTALSEAQKRRVVARAGPVLRAVAQDERSQLRNRELAIDRLVARLAEALKVERRRVPTKPTQASKEQRLESKRRRSSTKRLRRVSPDE